jgi:uncharacterized protein with HEPN domain
MKDDFVYLYHIQECIQRIEENIVGGRDQFMASHTLQDAVLRNLQTMTESTQRLSESLKTVITHLSFSPWSGENPVPWTASVGDNRLPPSMATGFRQSLPE